MQILKKIIWLTIIMSALGIFASAQVTVTGSTGANNTYPTLKDAFDAVNAGDQTGNNISVAITANTTETASAVLNAGLWTSLTIRPTVAATVSGSIVGAVIKLNSADNVTIDGRIGGAGTGRSLTVANTSAAAATAAIWLGSGTAAGSGATNNVIRNLELAGGAAQDALTVSTFGIIMSGATISTTSNGVDNDSNSFIANRIIRVRYGIVTRGTTTDNSLNAVVTDNIVGPAAFGADQIGKAGIFMQADTGATVSRNTVQFVGACLLTLTQTCTTGADRVGIGIGSESWGAAAPGTITSGDYTVTRNIIHDVVEERTFSAAGILAATTRGGAATNNLIANNFIYNVRANGTAGDQVVGLGIAGGHTDRIVFNSISIIGDMDPGTTAAASIYGNAVRIANASGATHANLTLMNNSILMDVNSNTATLPFFAVTINSATYSFGTGGLNHNNYYFPPANAQMNTGGISATATAPPAAQIFNTLAQWRTALTPPQDANSIQADPQYVSNTADLHIAAASPNVNAGTTIAGVNSDIDGQIRVGIPDIGADEPAGTPPPPNDIAANSFVFPGNGATIATGIAFAPQASFVNSGAATQTNVPVRYRITNSAMTVVCNVTATIPTIAAGQSVTVTFPTCNLTAAGTYTIQATAELVGDQTPGNDSISGTITAVAPVSGTVNVGAGGAFTSLTNSDGAFAAINLVGAAGNVTLNITSDLTAETGAVALNEVAGGFTVTIKPSGAARSITGSTAATGGLIKLSGADNVTIDGSLSGGTDRSLTINQTGLGAIIWITTNASSGANSNTVKNTILIGEGSSQGVIAGSGATLGGAAEFPQSNNTIQNNVVRAVQNAAFISGAPTNDLNWSITDNAVGGTAAADKLSFRGFILINSTNLTISRNLISGISSAPGVTATLSGIQVAGIISGGSITRNEIKDIRQNNPTGFGSNGVYMTATSTASNLLIANNFISDIASQGNAGVLPTNNGYGIAVATGGGYNIHFNSVNMNTNQVNSASITAAVNIAAAVPAGAIDLRNNILVNTQTIGTRYGVYVAATAGAAVFSTINYNDYFAQNVGFLTTARTTLADWQTATGGDANSKAVDPLFVSATDLHLQPTSTLINMGIAAGGVTTDFDGQTRDAMPDIGADEVIGTTPQNGTLALSAATYTVGEAAGTVTVTVNRTNGSTGAVSATYSLANGTATGGATCAAGVDFVNTGGTVNFAAGETTKTFTVTICNDTAVEPSETFTVTLAGATGGATIGTPATATVTITDDDVSTVPSLTINDVRVFEGNAGTVNAVFTVTASMTSTTAFSVTYSTANNTATAGVDYTATSGTLTFTPGQTTQTITVQIIGDTIKEANETFFVNLNVPTGATIADPQGLGVIVDDDRAIVADFDNDRRTDLSVFRPSTGYWYSMPSGTGVLNFTLIGVNGDLPVPGDYDGDARTDVAVFRPSNGTWYIRRSSDNVLVQTQWGFGTDKPVQGDFDGDGRTDIAVFRPSNGVWYVLRSSGGTFLVAFGTDGDVPVQGDYDGDARTDYAVYRGGIWYVLNSSTNTVTAINFGAATDKPLVGDFDGDGKGDYAVYRSGIWYIFQSQTRTSRTVAFGAASDIPIVGDYDGDGTSDIAVFRPSNGVWYILRSSNNGFSGTPFGQNGDIPIPAGYQSLQ